MRISRLALERYGHLSDIALDFPSDRGLHVVLGANEAGKSTALAAIGDALFGFPHRTEFAFLHAARDLRVGLTLCAADGRAAGFVRRKGRRDDLQDVHGAPLAQEMLTAFLGGATRERFDHVFGLNAAELRRGGAAILEGKGDAGETILQAHTGLHGFRALADRLDGDAERLFGDRRGKHRELHVAVEQFKAARRELDERAVEPSAFRRKSDERDQMRGSMEANRAEAERLHAERNRLDRIRRTMAARLALAHCAAARSAIGRVASLPADAEAQRQAAVLAGAKAAHALERERALEAETQQLLDAVEVESPVLAEGETIDRLVADRNAILQARRDRETQRILAEKSRKALQDMARKLGLPGDAENLAARIPDALARDDASRAITEHVRLSALAHKADEQGEAAVAAQAAARLAVEALPAPRDLSALLTAMDAAKAEARVDAECTSGQRAVAAAETELERRLAALPLWTGSAAALAAAKVPLDSMVSDHAQMLAACEAEERARQDEHATLARTLGEHAAERQRIGDADELPTAAAVAALRDRRDQAWGRLDPHVRGATAAPAELADGFERLLREADRLADRRAADATRVASFEHLVARELAVAAQLQAAADRVAEAGIARAEAQRLWEDLWRPIGIHPGAPAVMAEWRRRREEVLTQLLVMEEAAGRLAEVELRRDAIWQRLAQVLSDDLADVIGDVGALLRAAERLRHQSEVAGVALSQANTRAESAGAAVAAAEREGARIAQAQADWRARWQSAAASLGLDAAASAERGKLALELWNQVDLEVAAWRETEARIAQMTSAIEDFAAEARGAGARVGLDRTDPDAILRQLSERLQAARAAAEDRRKLMAAREKLRLTIEGLETTHEEAQGRLAALRLLAGADDDDQLQAAIRQEREFAELSRQIAERQAELSRLDDGKSIGELEAEAEGTDPDLLPARLAEIEARLRAITEENTANAGQMTGLDRELAEMTTGHHAADAAQDMENALADIEDIAARYVRLRLAHTLLRAGIDRFRREQQGPLLRRAGTLFGQLTEGRYDQLAVDQFEDEKVMIVARRPDGSECRAERLSEGTRDQLYLALRLAAIETFAVHSEPLPFIADDLLVNFDDRRARAALRVLGQFGRVTQTILFTHHAHIADMAAGSIASLHHLPSSAGVDRLDRVG